MSPCVNRLPCWADIELKHSHFNALHVTRQILAVVLCTFAMPLCFADSGTGNSGGRDLLLAQLPYAGNWHVRLDTNFPMGHTTAKKQNSAAATRVSAKGADSETDPLKRAQAAIRDNDDTAAMEILDAAIKSNPKDRMLYEARGKCCARVGQTYRALQDFTRALELGAPTAVLYRERANTYFSLHDFEHCLVDVDAAAKLSKSGVDDYLMRANCQSSLGHPEKVIENCTQALKLEPKSSEAYYVRAKAYSILKQQKSADADYEKAVSLKK